MPLPKIDYPTHEIFLRSLGRKVKFRPFLVKEEKILLLALESADKKGQYLALKQILKNCILSPIDPNKLTTIIVGAE